MNNDDKKFNQNNVNRIKEFEVQKPQDLLDLKTYVFLMNT